MAGGLFGGMGLAAPNVPATPIPCADMFWHFPDRTHAVVWRNWHAVEPERIAKVLGTSVGNVTAMAESMGLPPAVPIPREQRSRGYFFMTLCRRNWHLLPLDQLAELLGTTSGDLMQFLQVEEQANWVILGRSKPDCEPVRYRPPGPEARHRAARIKEIVHDAFGDEIRHGGQPRFEFVSRLGAPMPRAAAPSRANKRLISPRIVCSYLKIYGDPLMDPAVDMYPEGLLQRLADVGVDGVWLYGVLRDLAPGGSAFPEFGVGHTTRQANLRTLVARAKRCGIGVYLYINEPRAMDEPFFKHRPDMRGIGNGMCTSHPAVRQWMEDALAHLFANVPDLAGVFTITASENQTNCAWSAKPELCPRCRHRSGPEIIAEVNSVIEAGVHRGNPEAKVIAWDWAWGGRNDPAEIIPRLPKSCWLMSVSEWSQPIQRGGVQATVGEYSVSVIGPGPRASRHWDLARRDGLKTAAKVQVNTSWELASLPYLPVLDLVAEHCRNLAHAGVDGMMLAWSLGGYPSPNLEVADRFSITPVPTMDEALDGVARSRFGPEAAPHARKAWTAFSRAFQEYPYSVSVLYRGPMQLGPANPLYPTRTNWKATMVGFPFDDIASWCAPYPPEVFASQCERVAALWEQGLPELEAAAAKTPAPLRVEAERELIFARAARLYFLSAANQVRFVLARDALADFQDPLSAKPRQEQLQGILQIVRDESELAREMFKLARMESCIGYEAASQYFYMPLDLAEKVIGCQEILARYSDLTIRKNASAF
jgi:hypothetical protein